MNAATTHTPLAGPRYRGLRMTADQYLQLPDDGFRYELVDGVVQMSPSPTPRHQRAAIEIATQLHNHVGRQRLGLVLYETDVCLGKSPHGGDLVYRPDIIFIRKSRVPKKLDRIIGAPDLIVEILSPDSRSYDDLTKRADYERAGVREYWLIDPERRMMTFFRRVRGRYVEVKPVRNRFRSLAVPGFSLDLRRVRETF